MYSGKTTELLRLKNRSKYINKKILTIKYYNDIRYGEDLKLTTHDGIKDIDTHNDIMISNGKSLYNTIINVKDICNYDEIYIDEIQFYDDAKDVCEHLANLGIDLIICGLQGDYKRNIFKSIADLIPIAEKITHLTSLDKESKKECSYTCRLSNSNELELIGGTDLYIATDRANYFKYASNS